MHKNIGYHDMCKILMLKSDGDFSSPGMLLLDEAIEALKEAYAKVEKLETFLNKNRSCLSQNKTTPERTAKRARSPEDFRDSFNKKDSKKFSTPAGLEQFTDADLSDLPRKKRFSEAQKPEESSEYKNRTEYKIFFRLSDKKADQSEIMEAFSSLDIGNFKITDYMVAGRHTKGLFVTEDRPSYIKVLEERYSIKIGNRRLFITPCQQPSMK